MLNSADVKLIIYSEPVRDNIKPIERIERALYDDYTAECIYKYIQLNPFNSDVVYVEDIYVHYMTEYNAENIDIRVYYSDLIATLKWLILDSDYKFCVLPSLTDNPSFSIESFLEVYHSKSNFDNYYRYVDF